MTLRDILVSPPIWFDDDINTVTITWSLPGPQAWWEMTWQGRPDPTLGEWWSRIGELVRSGLAPSLLPPPTSTGSAMYSVTRLLDIVEHERERVLASRAIAAEATAARSTGWSSRRCRGRATAATSWFT